jgi:hypothetical protein
MVATDLVRRAVQRQLPATAPAPPRLLVTPVGAAFGAVSALRSARSLHPHGVVCEAVLEIDAPLQAREGGSLFSRPGAYEAVIRLSRGAGLPRPLPDIHGCAVRLIDAYGPARHQDFLLASSLGGPLLHHLLVPTRGFWSRPYSSVLLYALDGDIMVVGALPPRPSAVGHGRRLTLAVAKPLGTWRPVGEIRLGDPVPLEEGERIRFHPWNTGPGIRPWGPFMRLRDPAYRGSQRGWSAPAS